MPEQLGDAELLDRVVLDNQQPLAAGLDVILDPRQGRFEVLGGARLIDEGEGAAGESVLTVLVERHDLHRDVPGGRILLQLTEHGPTQHVGQKHVERDRGRLILAGKRQRLGATHRDQDLEPLVVRQIGDDPGIVRVVFDDQQHRIARFKGLAIVRHRFDRQLGEAAR